jgi:hypothetical protein
MTTGQKLDGRLLEFNSKMIMKHAGKGRPRIEERAKTNEARKPWLKLEMSRRTWYRRQAEKRIAPKEQRK